jgi:tetratricopeptide (TPR) repeat protein
MQLKKRDDGIAHFQEAIKCNPNNSLYLDALARALSEKGDYEGAKKASERAVSKLDHKKSELPSSLLLIGKGDEIAEALKKVKLSEAASSAESQNSQPVSIEPYFVAYESSVKKVSTDAKDSKSKK